MPYIESDELALIDDTLAALSSIGESTALLILRQWDRIPAEDRHELRVMVAALDRARDYQKALRQPIADRYQRSLQVEQPPVQLIRRKNTGED